MANMERLPPAAVAAAAVNVAGAVLLVGLRLSAQDSAVDGLGPVALGAIYLAPGVLALFALRGRDPLLLPAALAALALSVFPFSLHSFVLGPIGVVYLVSYMRAPTRGQETSRSMAAALLCPVLLVAAFVALLVHEDPVCYEERQSGEVIVDRDPPPVESGSQTIGPDSDVVERGCTSDTVVWWETAASLALSAGALATGLVLVARREPQSPETLAQSSPL